MTDLLRRVHVWCDLNLAGVPAETLLFGAVRRENYERAQIIHETTGEKLTIEQFQKTRTNEREATSVRP